MAERMGKGKAIRRLYCRTCGHRFSEREGSLMGSTKLAEEVVVRMVKCLAYGCSMEATADICDVDPRTVERMLEKAGQRSEDFHRLQLERVAHPPEAILRVFGVLQYRRRKGHRGRKPFPTLKPPLGLLVGVVEKLRDAKGNLLKVKAHALFGLRKDIQRRIKKLKVGRQINTSHLERVNGIPTCRDEVSKPG